MVGGEEGKEEGWEVLGTANLKGSKYKRDQASGSSM